MGLLDSAVGGLMNADSDKGTSGMLGGMLSQLGGASGGSNKMLVVIMGLVQQVGGLDKLMAKFTASGMGDLVASWVGGGDNLPISVSQVKQVFGDSAIKDAASKLGVVEAHASSSIASMLPELISKLTPNNTVDASSNDMLSQGMSMLSGQLGK